MIRTVRSKAKSALRAALATALIAAPVVLVPPTVATAATGDLLISGVVDGPLSGGTPKAVELFVVNDIPDLSVYGLGSANNGGGSDGEEFTFPAVSATAGDFIYLASESAGFSSFFGFAPDYTSSAASINGDDAIELFMGGAVVDVFGDINVDGTGQPWEHLDGWAYRVDDTGQDGPTFVLANWFFSGPNALDGETTNAGAATPFPIGTYSAAMTGGPADPVINEFVANHTGADTDAFVEVLGDASTDYSAYTVLEIEGDSPNQGVIDAVLPVGTTNGGGYWIDDEDMENGTLTLLLVEGFSGVLGEDLDTNDDGTFDSTPWTRIVDDVAPSDGGGSDVTYSTSVLAPFFDGNPFGAGGASRIPNGTDTDTVADWTRNDFDGFGFPGFPGSPAVGEAENTPDAVNAAITVATDPVGVCGDAATLIHDIQGSGLASSDVGSIREIEGVVTGDFEDTSTGLGGFFMQEETTDFDGDGTTSEGIFVFNNGVGSVNSGETVRVRGSVTEFNGLTELNNVVSVTGCPATGTTAPASWSLPVSAVNDWEWVEGMQITISQTLHASGNFTWARFGEVDLSINGPLDNPTNVVAPGAPANALQDLNNRSRIQLDDASTVQNPLPFPPYLGAGNTLRTGDTIPGLTGNLGFSFGNYEIHPTQSVDFTRVNVRPGVPDVGGSIQVAAYNVLNYFTTIDDSGPICGPLGNQGCRGADTASEFNRQRDKIVTAISTLDADVVGLMEIENAPDNTPEADLVSGLNAATGSGTYDYIATGPIGGDAIRVALLYQPAAVTPVGGFEVLDSGDDPAFDDTLNRPMLVQTFMENATGSTFTVGVNHLKSKGSNCDSVGDPDTGDGQGNCNLTRTAAAQAIVDFLATDPTGSGDSDFLIIGDLNAYAMEDPVTTIESGGYTDLIEAFVGTGYGAGAYSFNFFSQSGYLDHGLSSGTMTPQVTGAAFWHVNADEPSGLDYNNFNQPGLYEPDEFRSSDHDPVVIGLDLDTAMSLKLDAVDELSGLLPTGNNPDDRRIARAIQRIEQSLNPDWWTGPSTLDPKQGKKVFTRERQAVNGLEKVSTVDVQSAIDKLVDADRLLAERQKQIAIDAGADPGDIAHVQEHLDAAEEEVAHGHFADAIHEFREAWIDAVAATPPPPVRFATFNASLNRSSAGALATELSSPGSQQPDVIAEIIQRTRPEVVLINEFDYDAGNVALDGFQENYLSVAHGTAAPILYPYRYTAPSNTGIFSGFDLDNSGAAGDFVPGDSFGFGFFEGQFGMAVYSMHPIEVDDIRTFQNFLWKDMPGALLPDDPSTPDPADWYSDEELEVFRLSSKSHWDVPIDVDGKTVHFLVSHPTPPVFDGPEDRNGTRNFDEIRFWADYVTGGRDARYIYDDDGRKGGLKRNAKFVIAGDQNSDPLDGDSIPGAIQQLLDNARVNTSVTPASPGGTEQAALQGGANTTHLSDPAFDTADFSDSAPGNLRADYVLPSHTMSIRDAGVFWPSTADPLFGLVGTSPFPSSDHRLVWVDVGVHH